MEASGVWITTGSLPGDDQPQAGVWHGSTAGMSRSVGNRCVLR